MRPRTIDINAPLEIKWCEEQDEQPAGDSDYLSASPTRRDASPLSTTPRARSVRPDTVLIASSNSRARKRIFSEGSGLGLSSERRHSHHHHHQHASGSDEYYDASDRMKEELKGGDDPIDIPIPGVRRAAGYESLFRVGERFERPASYIHYTDPTAIELEDTIEYCLDDFDDEFLLGLNRGKPVSERLSEDKFEEAINLFEKEAFRLRHHVNDDLTTEADLPLLEMALSTNNNYHSLVLPPSPSSATTATTLPLASNSIGSSSTTTSSSATTTPTSKLSTTTAAISTRSNAKPTIATTTSSSSSSSTHARTSRRRRSSSAATSTTEDTPCAICNDPDFDSDSDNIVFCDGCNVAVHQMCYGIDVIPKGPWFCAVCQDCRARHRKMKDREPECVLCLERGGALKKTSEGEWAHVFCALWTPETGFGDPNAVEPITGVGAIRAERRALQCGVCKQRNKGVCIQCKVQNCYEAFHPMCARRAKYYMSIDPGKQKGRVLFHAYCLAHSKERRLHEQYGLKSKADILFLRATKAIKTAMQHQLGLSRATFEAIWSHWLRRRLVRGGPLIPRLFLELEAEHQRAKAKRKKPRLAEDVSLEQLLRLRQDLERIRLLLDMVLRRESYKKEILELTLHLADKHSLLRLVSPAAYDRLWSNVHFQLDDVALLDLDERHRHDDHDHGPPLSPSSLSSSSSSSSSYSSSSSSAPSSSPSSPSASSSLPPSPSSSSYDPASPPSSPAPTTAAHTHSTSSSSSSSSSGHRHSVAATALQDSLLTEDQCSNSGDDAARRSRTRSPARGSTTAAAAAAARSKSPARGTTTTATAAAARSKSPARTTAQPKSPTRTSARSKSPARAATRSKSPPTRASTRSKSPVSKTAHAPPAAASSASSSSSSKIVAPVTPSSNTVGSVVPPGSSITASSSSSPSSKTLPAHHRHVSATAASTSSITTPLATAIAIPVPPNNTIATLGTIHDAGAAKGRPLSHPHTGVSFSPNVLKQPNGPPPRAYAATSSFSFRNGSSIASTIPLSNGHQRNFAKKISPSPISINNFKVSSTLSKSAYSKSNAAAAAAALTSSLSAIPTLHTASSPLPSVPIATTLSASSIPTSSANATVTPTTIVATTTTTTAAGAANASATSSHHHKSTTPAPTSPRKHSTSTASSSSSAKSNASSTAATATTTAAAMTPTAGTSKLKHPASATTPTATHTAAPQAVAAAEPLSSKMIVGKRKATQSFTSSSPRPPSPPAKRHKPATVNHHHHHHHHTSFPPAAVPPPTN